MTATYWEVGRRIVKFEQDGARRAAYGAALLKRLSIDLTDRFGRGFSVDNLENMRLCYGPWSSREDFPFWDKVVDFDRNTRVVFIRFVGTHDEYDRIDAETI